MEGQMYFITIQTTLDEQNSGKLQYTFLLVRTSKMCVRLGVLSYWTDFSQYQTLTPSKYMLIMHLRISSTVLCNNCHTSLNIFTDSSPTFQNMRLVVLIKCTCGKGLPNSSQIDVSPTWILGRGFWCAQLLQRPKFQFST